MRPALCLAATRIAVDGHGQHKAFVVISMVPDQVDSTRRAKESRLAGAIHFLKRFSQRPTTNDASF